MNESPGSAHPVTVSIVLHGQWHMVQPLLHDLQRHCASLIDQVVLTVNKPERGVETAGWEVPIRRIDNAVPQGFGANHNAAFRHCRTPWFLVLNPDIRLERDAISDLLSVARADAGLLAPRIHEPGKAEPEPYRDVLTPLELLRRRLSHHEPPARPAWVPGMFMLLRREAYEAVGGFDERFFMYCEDFDLCARLHLAGWRLQLEDDVIVEHQAQRASNSSLRPLLWHVASLLRLWSSSTVWRYRAALEDQD